MTKNKTKSLRNIAAILVSVLVFAVLVAGAFTLRATYKPYTIETTSMLPSYPVGTQVYVKKVDVSTLKPGDIITFQQNTDVYPTTHTFIGLDKEGHIMTKGQHNPTPDVRDVPLKNSDVLGKVAFKVPFFVHGFWTSVHTLTMVAIMLAVIAGLVVLAIVYNTGKRKDPQLDQRTRELAHT